MITQGKKYSNFVEMINDPDYIAACEKQRIESGQEELARRVKRGGHDAAADPQGDESEKSK